MFDVRYDQERDLVLGSFAGIMDLASLQEYTREAAQVAKGHDCHRFLNDLRAAELDLSTLALHDLPETLHGWGLDIPTLRRALIVSRDLEAYCFFETLSVNRGDILAVFVDEEEALEWLDNPSPYHPPAASRLPWLRAQCRVLGK